MNIGSKSGLAIILSRLKKFKNPKSELEQYESDSEIAAEILWNAYIRRELENKVVADLGAGTGLLGIGALVLGAKKVFFVEKDLEATKIIKENIIQIEENFGEKLLNKIEIINKDITLFDEKVDIVIQNPPFGIKGKRHADKAFLQKSISIADIIYSFHTIESKPLIQALSRDYSLKIEGYWEFSWPLKKTMKFHKKKIEYIKVGCWRILTKPNREE